MDIGKALNDSLEYAKDAVWGKWARWILLIVSTIIFPLIWGYRVEVYRGKKPAPEPTNWGGLFVDGIKLLVIEIIYLIPVFIVLFIFIGTGVLLAMRGSPGAILAGIGSIAAGLLITLIVALIVILFMAMGAVRFARTGKMGEAFNFHAILEKIGKIGRGTYIVSLIVIAIVAGIIAIILSVIPVIGWLLLLIVDPALVIFVARYITLLYDSVPDQAAAPAA
ncbi:MAG TPA: DUF4013 domain-containing protein [Methanomicrobiales archaeon]|nr:DUF4013 domain-containing protein [Methanomicrobiales archaeon]